ncbi:MAG TPA: GTP 3',8-cyclase MoaA [Candidatus Binatia bacterium]
MLVDTFNRTPRDLRISVTDRCNFRCTYCMPFDEYTWIDKREILTFEEITRLATLFVQLGIDKVRITGGEPLVRQDIEDLVGKLASVSGIEDLSLTTNGSLLAEKAEALKAAGLQRINLSIDTLDPEKFKRMTKRGNLTRVLEGLWAAKRARLDPIKINAVVERGVNEEDILELAEFCRRHGFELRFIEYMDVGNSNHWASDKMVSKKEILERIRARFPLREVGRDEGSAPSVDYEYLDGAGRVGVIASVTEPFCSSCTRARLTADGKLVTCLFSQTGHDLKALLRSGSTDEAILEFVSGIWRARNDRYSDDRLKSLRSSSYDPARQKKIEMITLGG